MQVHTPCREWTRPAYGRGVYKDADHLVVADVGADFCSSVPREQFAAKWTVQPSKWWGVERFQCVSVCIVQLHTTPGSLDRIRTSVRYWVNNFPHYTSSEVHAWEGWVLDQHVHIALVACVDLSVLDTVKRCIGRGEVFFSYEGLQQAWAQGAKYIAQLFHDKCPVAQGAGTVWTVLHTTRDTHALEREPAVRMHSHRMLASERVTTLVFPGSAPRVPRSGNLYICCQGACLNKVYMRANHALFRHLRSVLDEMFAPLWTHPVPQRSVACNRDCATPKRPTPALTPAAPPPLTPSSAAPPAAPPATGPTYDKAAWVMEMVLDCITPHLSVLDMLRLGTTCRTLRTATDTQCFQRRRQAVLPQAPLVAPTTPRLCALAALGIIAMQLNVSSLDSVTCPAHVLPHLMHLTTCSLFPTIHRVADMARLRVLHITDTTHCRIALDFACLRQLLTLYLVTTGIKYSHMTLPYALQSIHLTVHSVEQFATQCRPQHLHLTMHTILPQSLRGLDFGAAHTLSRLELRQQEPKGAIDNPPFLCKFAVVRRAQLANPVTCTFLAVLASASFHHILPAFGGVQFMRVLYDYTEIVFEDDTVRLPPLIKVPVAALFPLLRVVSVKATTRALQLHIMQALDVQKHVIDTKADVCIAMLRSGEVPHFSLFQPFLSPGTE